MNLTRKQKALYSAGVLWVLFFGGLIFLPIVVDVLLGVLYLIGWVLALRFTNPRVAHLPPAERFGIGTDDRPAAPGAPPSPGRRGPADDDLPSVVVPHDPEEQARLAAARAEREAERAEAKHRRDAAKAAEKERKRAEREEAEAARREAQEAKTEKQRLETEAKARREADERELRLAEEQAAREAEDLARREAEALAARDAEATATRDAEAAVEARQAEDARLAEEARQAEEARVAEEARLAEEARQAEASRVAEEARQAEEARVAEEARQAAVIDEAAVQSDQDILAASGVAALEGSDQSDDQTDNQRTAALLDKVRLRLSDYE